LAQAFLKKWWVESDFKASNLPLSLRLYVSGCHYDSIYNNAWTKQVKQLSNQRQAQWSKCQKHLRHTLIKKRLTFLLKPYLYTFSLYENPSFIIFSAEREYISCSLSVPSFLCRAKRKRHLWNGNALYAYYNKSNQIVHCSNMQMTCDMYSTYS
jgi:hypothetical protein